MRFVWESTHTHSQAERIGAFIYEAVSERFSRSKHGHFGGSILVFGAMRFVGESTHTHSPAKRVSTDFISGSVRFVWESTHTHTQAERTGADF